jgi:anti-sigma B factor antagonist
VQDKRLVVDELPQEAGQPNFLRLKGPVVLDTLPEFRAKVLSARSHNLVLDMTGVPYMDSAGIGALVMLYVRHQRDGRAICLLGTTDRVHEVLKLAQVAQFFQFISTLNEAEPNPA